MNSLAPYVAGMTWGFMKNAENATGCAASCCGIGRRSFTAASKPLPMTATAFTANAPKLSSPKHTPPNYFYHKR
ncbi:hypothetical protein NYE74_14015 [Paenibacillus sp. FSL P4-0127]|uniref:hypothetical protein n=1 Tax=Paenibacillus sp. FSL P4-0127 TaxID=2975318 RepID=UPI0030FCB07E